MQKGTDINDSLTKAESLFKEGFEHLRGRDFPAASVLFLKVAEIAPDFILSKTDKIKRSFQSLRKVYFANDEFKDGKVYDESEAQNIVLGIVSVAATTYKQWGDEHLSNGDNEKAVDFFAKSLALCKDDALCEKTVSIYCTLGAEWLEKKETNKAEEYFRKALTINNDYKEARMLLSEILLQKGRLLFEQRKNKVALNVIEECLRFNPENKTAKGILEQRLLRQQKREETKVLKEQKTKE